MSVLYLVRHAHAVWTPDENRPLSERGKQDAQRVADTLESLSLAALYSSPAMRARQTIEPLAQRRNLVIEEIAGLQERLLTKEPVEDFSAAVRCCWDYPGQALPGGESNLAAQARGVAIVESLLSKHVGETVVVATHGNLLALVLQHFTPEVDFGFWQSLSMPDIYRVTVECSTGTAAVSRTWQPA